MFAYKTYVYLLKVGKKFAWTRNLCFKMFELPNFLHVVAQLCFSDYEIWFVKDYVMKEDIFDLRSSFPGMQNERTVNYV